MKNSSSNSRRNFLKHGTLAALGVGVMHSLDAEIFSGGTEAPGIIVPDEGPFTLPPLPYGYDALEPYIDTKTMQIHHDKHHAGYVSKLNDAVAKEPSLKGKSLEDLIMHINDLPESVRTAVRNNGGGDWNHTFFWNVMTPHSDKSGISDKLKTAINNNFQSMDNMRGEFIKAALGVFGSGWAWIVTDKNGKLSIITTPNQDNPLMDVSMDHGKPILGIDVWEHAYYLKHQNMRSDYVNDFFNVINWSAVSAAYEGM